MLHRRLTVTARSHDENNIGLVEPDHVALLTASTDLDSLVEAELKGQQSSPPPAVHTPHQEVGAGGMAVLRPTQQGKSNVLPFKRTAPVAGTKVT
jgi:hypothetical protein